VRLYTKALCAFFGSLGTWGASAGADGVYDQIELWGLTGVALTTLAVFALPNTPTDE
jgi:hypothetical protein